MEWLMFLLHHHQMNLAERTPETELTCHHVAYVGMALVTARMISTLIPVDQVKTHFFTFWNT